MQNIFLEERVDTSEIPDISGLVFRSFRGETDNPLIVEIFNACKEIDGVEHTLEEEYIAHNYQHLESSDPFKDMIFAEVNGRAIAYSMVGYKQERQEITYRKPLIIE